MEFSLQHDVMRGTDRKLLVEQQAPQSRFMSEHEIQRADSLTYDPHDPGGKILMGRFGDRYLGTEDPRHVLTVAGSQTGKSVLLKTHLMHTRASVIATDLKGELSETTALARMEMGQDVYILDPLRIVKGPAAQRRARFNPLAMLKPDSPTLIEDAGALAEAIIVATGEEKDPHWNESAQQFLEGLILLVVLSDTYQGQRNLITVSTLIKRALQPIPGLFDEMDRPVLRLWREMLQLSEALEHDDLDSALANAIEGAANDFFEKGTNERGSVLSTLRRNTRFLTYRGMRDVLSGSDFDLTDLKTNPNGVTIYLVLPASKLGVCHRWFRMIINQLFTAMEQAPGVPATGHKTLVALDEFPAAIGNLNIVRTAMGLMAGKPYHVKLWPIVQDFNQLKRLFNDGWETFVANCGTVIAFGINDHFTADYLSNRLGRTPIEASHIKLEDGRPSRTPAIELHDLMSAEEVTRYFARDDEQRRSLVLMAGRHPMILQRAEWFRDRISQHA